MAGSSGEYLYDPTCGVWIYGLFLILLVSKALLSSAFYKSFVIAIYFASVLSYSLAVFAAVELLIASFLAVSMRANHIVALFRGFGWWGSVRNCCCDVKI